MILKYSQLAYRDLCIAIVQLLEKQKGYKMQQYLTEREMSVLVNLTNGSTNTEIAEILFISVHTVKAHLEAIYEKLGVTNRVQAAMKAVKLGLIEINKIPV